MAVTPNNIPSNLSLEFFTTTAMNGLKFEIARKEHHILLKFDFPAEPAPITAEEEKRFNDIQQAVGAGFADQVVQGKKPPRMLSETTKRENFEKSQRQAATLIERLLANPAFSFVDTGDIPHDQYHAPDISDEERKNSIFIAPAEGTTTKAAYWELCNSLKRMGITQQQDFARR